MAIRQTIIKRYESQQWVDNYPVTAWAYIENIPSTFPPSAHTHNYAGSSSAGGDANNAVKLNGQTASYYLNYNNFTNTPTIPTKTSQLTNDSGYLTSSTLTGDVVIDALGYTPGTSNFSGSYNDLTNKPSIPTKVSQLSNDMGYITGITSNDVIAALGYTPGTSNFTGYTSSNKLSVSYISGLATVATSGSYNDLSNKPTIPTKASWNYDDRYVRYDTASQGLNDTQKSNARTNIGAGTSNFTGYTSSNKLSTSYISGLATVATSGSYNDLSNKPTIPTKTSQLTNDSGYLTSSTLTGDVVIDALGYTPGTYSKPSGGIPASDLAQTYYLASNPNGYTSNIGTVTTVKLGSTSYSPSSGVISLPAYPTTLPASDVYSWAKASTKPSYNYSEVGAAAAHHLYHTWDNNTNYYDSYEGGNMLRIITENMYADLFRFQASTVSNLQYHNGSSWVTWSFDLSNLFDGNARTGVSIPYANRKFRFEMQTNGGWPTTGMFMLQGRWFSDGGWPDGHNSDIIIETRANTSAAWTQRASFTLSGVEGMAGHTLSVLHTGDTYYRITITIYRWTNTSNSCPLQRLCLFSNYNGGALEPIRYTGTGNVIASGSISATSFTENGTALANKYLGKTATAADSSKLNGQAASYYLNYNNLSNKPTIPTYTSQLTNDSGFITGITSSMVTTALGYTPYNSSNPNGYTSNTGTVTSVAVKMNGSVKGTITTSGTIDLGTVITSHQDISGKADKASMSAGWYRRVYVNTQGIVTEGDQGDTDTNTWRKVQLNGVDKLGNATNTNPLNIKNGSGITITESSGAFTFALNLTGDLVGDALGYTPLSTTGTAADSSKLNGQAASYYLNYNNLSNKPTIYTDCVRYVSQSLTDAQKSQARTNIGAGTSNFTGYTSSNKLGTGYIQGITEFDTLTEEISSMYSIMGTKYVKPSGGIPASDLAQTYYLASNPNGYTSNIGTVTTVKLGSTSYSPSSGVISLPAYPTTLPASDVYSWAKASTKPSYNFGEIGAGNATIGDGANYLLFRTNDSWRSGLYYHTNGNEALVLGYVNANTSIIFANVDPANRPDWTGISTGVQIKKASVMINKILGNNVNPSYNLDVNGTANATTLYENGTSLASKYLGISATAADSSKLNGQAASYYLNYNNLSNKPTIPNVPSWALQSSKPSYDASEISCDAFGDDVSSILQAMDSAIGGKAASNHTHDTRYVRFDTASQGLNATQKSNARTNIGAGTSNFSGNYNDLTNKPNIPSVITTVDFIGYLYFNDDKNTTVWFEIPAISDGFSEGMFIVVPESSYSGYKSDNAQYWQGTIAHVSSSGGGFKIWKTQGDSCGYVKFTYSGQSVTVTRSDCAADYGKFRVYKVNGVNEP